MNVIGRLLAVVFCFCVGFNAHMVLERLSERDDPSVITSPLQPVWATYTNEYGTVSEVDISLPAEYTILQRAEDGKYSWKYQTGLDTYQSAYPCATEVEARRNAHDFWMRELDLGREGTWKEVSK